MDLQGMRQTLTSEEFLSISEPEKEFIFAFDDEMTALGYPSLGRIGNGYCWGQHMIIYAKDGVVAGGGVKGKPVIARIFIRDHKIRLRLFLNQMEKHTAYLEKSHEEILKVLTGPEGLCKHCHNGQENDCRFRKTYNLFGKTYERCNGEVFVFRDVRIELVPVYSALLKEFNGKKR
jgi:hypothetical protein